MSKTGVQLIADERDRQVAIEQWSHIHDDLHHKNGELALAAEAYLRELRYRHGRDVVLKGQPSAPWPWEMEAWKPKQDPVRQLSIVGALVAAEIDRILRERGDL